MLVLQIPPKRREQHLNRSGRRRAAGRWRDTKRTQIPKQRIERPHRRSIGVPRRAARRAEALRHVRRQARHSSTFSSPAINTSGTISAKPLRLCTPHHGPMTLLRRLLDPSAISREFP
jgi:hypothetical protein